MKHHFLFIFWFLFVLLFVNSEYLHSIHEVEDGGNFGYCTFFTREGFPPHDVIFVEIPSKDSNGNDIMEMGYTEFFREGGNNGNKFADFRTLEVGETIEDVLNSRDGGNAVYNKIHGSRIDLLHETSFQDIETFNNDFSRDPNSVYHICLSAENTNCELTYRNSFYAKFTGTLITEYLEEYNKILDDYGILIIEVNREKGVGKSNYLDRLFVSKFHKIMQRKQINQQEYYMY